MISSHHQLLRNAISRLFMSPKTYSQNLLRTIEWVLTEAGFDVMCSEFGQGQHELLAHSHGCLFSCTVSLQRESGLKQVIRIASQSSTLADVDKGSVAMSIDSDEIITRTILQVLFKPLTAAIEELASCSVSQNLATKLHTAINLAVTNGNGTKLDSEKCTIAVH
ncbi:hypothetical protein [Vibrio sp. WXL103]|uniref:hypothetical protein n=1 Tax=unclassified Vibrio TaxID=2614977 RepID=UPI003EC68600